jgi:hypothetical protein
MREERSWRGEDRGIFSSKGPTGKAGVPRLIRRTDRGWIARAGVRGAVALHYIILLTSVHPSIKRLHIREPVDGRVGASVDDAAVEEDTVSGPGHEGRVLLHEVNAVLMDGGHLLWCTSARLIWRRIRLRLHTRQEKYLRELPVVYTRLQSKPRGLDEGGSMRGHDALPAVGRECCLALLRQRSARVLHVVHVLHLKRVCHVSWSEAVVAVIKEETTIWAANNANRTVRASIHVLVDMVQVEEGGQSSSAASSEDEGRGVREAHL